MERTAAAAAAEKKRVYRIDKKTFIPNSTREREREREKSIDETRIIRSIFDLLIKIYRVPHA